eukprot:4769529-Pyramimonas_sp.AAC.1
MALSSRLRTLKCGKHSSLDLSAPAAASASRCAQHTHTNTHTLLDATNDAHHRSWAYGHADAYNRPGASETMLFLQKWSSSSTGNTV